VHIIINNHVNSSDVIRPLKYPSVVKSRLEINLMVRLIPHPVLIQYSFLMTRVANSMSLFNLPYPHTIFIALSVASSFYNPIFLISTSTSPITCHFTPDVSSLWSILLSLISHFKPNRFP